MGVFTGSSALASALASERNAKVIAIDKSRKYVDIARKYWKQAEIQDKIDLRLGDANVVLEHLLNDHKEFVDFTYIDADKTNYVEYFKKCLILSRKGGIIAIDNTLFRGQVIHDRPDSKIVRAIQDFNEFVKNCSEVNVMMLPLADGYTIAIKR